MALCAHHLSYDCSNMSVGNAVWTKQKDSQVFCDSDIIFRSHFILCNATEADTTLHCKERKGCYNYSLPKILNNGTWERRLCFHFLYLHPAPLSHHIVWLIENLSEKSSQVYPLRAECTVHTVLQNNQGLAFNWMLLYFERFVVMFCFFFFS